jgi:LuxR family maltose regulon positive regulatory protein
MDPQQAMTAWLAEVARLPGEAILLIDDADQAAPQSRLVLDYLVANAPANLRIAVSLRPGGSFADAGLLATLPMMRITARELRLHEEETASLVHQLLASARDGEDLNDFAIQLHGQAAGWPLGVRLGIAARLRSPAGTSEARSLADIGRYMMTNLVDRQPTEISDLLVRSARFDPIHHDLLHAVFGPSAAIDGLTQILADSPISIGAGAEGWFRLHPAASEALRARQSRLLPESLRAEAAIASTWYAAKGMLEEAAQQASLAGDEAHAIELAEASLRRLLELGRSAEIIGWIERISPPDIAARPGLWAPAGWAYTNSGQFVLGRRYAEAIRQDNRSSDIDRHEADLILSTGAAHIDDHEDWGLLRQRWPECPKDAKPPNIMIHAVSIAHYAIISGQPEIARRQLVQAFTGAGPVAGAAPVSLGFANAFRALSYLWEGKPLLAIEGLRTSLAEAEAQMDRRSRVAVTLAAFLAEAALATGNPSEAARLLSQRTMLITREGLPDAVISACATLVELACDEGRQDRAIDRITALLGEGAARGSSRMQAAAHFAATRLHTRYRRPHSAARAADQAAALCDGLTDGVRAAERQYCELQAAMARATALHGSTKGEELVLAEQAAGTALALAGQLQRGADTARALFLRAAARRGLGNPAADDDQGEGVSYCKAGGLYRLEREFVSTGSPDPAHSSFRPAVVPELTNKPRAYSGSLLTPREYDVVCHLASHMSNKEVALAMDLREETVKWHVKNLFQKLGAGDRKTVVRRARMLGII